MNWICRNWSSILCMQQIPTLLCKKKNPAYGKHWLSWLIRIEAPIPKENLFFLVCKKQNQKLWGGVLRMGSENKNFQFLFWRGDTCEVGLLNAEDVEKHIHAKFSRIWAKFIFSSEQIFSCFWSNMKKFWKFNVFLKHF